MNMTVTATTQMGSTAVSYDLNNTYAINLNLCGSKIDLSPLYDQNITEPAIETQKRDMPSPFLGVEALYDDTFFTKNTNLNPEILWEKDAFEDFQVFKEQTQQIQVLTKVDRDEFTGMPEEMEEIDTSHDRPFSSNISDLLGTGPLTGFQSNPNIQVSSPKPFFKDTTSFSGADHIPSSINKTQENPAQEPENTVATFQLEAEKEHKSFTAAHVKLEKTWPF